MKLSDQFLFLVYCGDTGSKLFDNLTDANTYKDSNPHIESLVCLIPVQDIVVAFNNSQEKHTP